MIDQHLSNARAKDTAKRMLRRYRTAKMAFDMAALHATDHPEGSPRRDFWTKVKQAILTEIGGEEAL